MKLLTRGGLAACAIAGAALIAAGCGGSGGGSGASGAAKDAAALDLVPKNAIGYVTVDTDFEGDQWTQFSDLAKAFDKVRNHFGLGRLAQSAAVAALGDQAHLAQVQAAVTAGRARIGAIAASHGFAALPSATNFVTLDCGRDGDFARRVLAQLAQRGVFVRMPGVAPLDRCIRVSVGPDAALDAFEAALGPALKAVPL